MVVGLFAHPSKQGNSKAEMFVSAVPWSCCLSIKDKKILSNRKPTRVIRHKKFPKRPLAPATKNFMARWGFWWQWVMAGWKNPQPTPFHQFGPHNLEGQMVQVVCHLSLIPLLWIPMNPEVDDWEIVTWMTSISQQATMPLNQQI